jgi:prepilin-type processing-associated H-X9-DG protein
MLPPSGIVDPLMQQYTDINSSMFMYPVYDQRSGKMFSWAVLLLPYLEETNLYDQFDFSKTVLNQPREPQRQQVPVFNCPSDSGQVRLYSDHDYTNDKWFAKGNYAAYDSPMHSDLQLLYPGALIATGQKLSRILDGLSNTVCFSEVRTRDDLQDERGVWALPWNGASLLALDMHHNSVAAGTRDGDFQALAIPEILQQVQVPNMMYNPGDILVRCPGDTASNQLEGMPCHQWVWWLGLSGYISAAPRSNHIGGVNAAFLDGHVRFISDGIDPVEFAYLIDPRDSQVTSDAER